MNKDGDPNYLIPVPFFLLMHPKGHVVIDGGNAAETASDPRGYWGKVTDVYWPIMTECDGCVAQIDRLGVDVNDIRYVVLSHLHLDHTGSIGRFPNATHVVRKREYDYAHAPDWPAAGAYVSADFGRPGLRWQFLDGPEDELVDFFGDGVLTIIPTPGHTVGHQSFMVTLPETGSVILTCDAAYTFDHWNDMALPGLMASSIETVASVRKLRALAEKRGAMVVTGHDPEAWKSLKKAPDYYA